MLSGIVAKDEESGEVRDLRKKASRLSLISAKVEQWGKKSIRGTTSITKKSGEKVSRIFKPQQTGGTAEGESQ